jgi:hypothetical protein
MSHCGCQRHSERFAFYRQPPVLRSVSNTIGITGILGLGYGAGKDKFDLMVNQSARAMRLDLTGKYDRTTILYGRGRK